jgi:hypothetical protein
VADGQGESNVARVDIRVRPVNDDPTVGELPPINTVPGAPVPIDVLAQAKDVDGDPLTVQGAGSVHGRVEVNPNGSMVYTPNPGFTGEDTIVFVITDGAGGKAEGKITVHVVEPPPGTGEIEGPNPPGPIEGSPGG